MQRNSDKTLKNKLRINQIQLPTVIQIIVVAGKCFAETQAIIAYILLKLIFDKIQVIWMFQSTTTAAKLPSENFLCFFAIKVFFYY